ncbi:MAG: transporter substrate-binding domain-containing protein [Bacilli bacterium]|nr:transporter substrate-binding domain-containing protein [Bacilli bacterium]MDD4076859.1 transporter substrate-binding domain-containing protein [Bacilli bacterium]MDD4388182.1 transporter substrate-binding domain-containing protein [Bacilli bacterium]
MKKYFAYLLVVLVFLLSACRESENNIVVIREDQFIVGLECNYAPFNWTENNRSPYNYPINNASGAYADGYDVQIAKAVAASLGKVLVIEKLEWEALIPSLETGKIDAIIAGMSPTEDRKESVNFTDAYYRSTHVILMKKTSKYASANSINDFDGAKIVGQHGTVYDDLIDQMMGVKHATPLKSVPDILTAILGNKYDATILELPVAVGIVTGNPEFIYQELNPGFTVSEEDVTVSVALRLNDDNLTEKINVILSAITEEVRIKLMEQAVDRSHASEE